MRIRLTRSAAIILVAALFSGGAGGSTANVISSIDLSKPFGTRAAWRFSASQGSNVEDPVGGTGTSPGALTLCISSDEGRSCHPDFERIMGPTNISDVFSEPYFLDRAEVVWPHSRRALLIIKVASLHSGDGNQRVATQVLAYDERSDSFLSIYQKVTGRNNNQEVRYLTDGPLEGGVISAEPTGDAPFAFWITVNKLTVANAYVQVLRYRSATKYDDGNPLAVIDSEMPNIERRLGLRHLDSPLSPPKEPCPKPHLIKMELWCK